MTKHINKKHFFHHALKQLSSQAIETKPLGEIVEFLNHQRKAVSSLERIAGKYPYLGANGQQGTINNYLFNEKLVLLAEDGGHFLTPKRGIAYRIEGKAWVNNHAHVLRPKDMILWEYLEHYLRHKDIKKYVQGDIRMKLTKAKAMEIPISIPPLSIQKKIVFYLEKLSLLEAELKQSLQAELEMRKKYYAYILYQFFKFKNASDVLFIKLNDICHIYQSQTINKRDLIKNGSYPVFGANGIIGHYNHYNHEYPEIILGCRGSCGTVHITPPKTWITGNAMVIHPKDNRLHQRFLFYLLKNINFSKIITGSAQPQITRNALASLEIPLPDLKMQEKIITISEKLEIHLQEINKNIQKEILMREEQYHYYRNQLLDFDGY